MQKVLKPLATAAVVVLIVTPVPPTTIIGLAIAANPKTNKYLDPFTIKVVNAAMKLLFSPVKVSVKKVATGRELSARNRIEKRIVRL